MDPLGPLKEYQAGRCAACSKAGRPLVVDHDHISGWVRGLLCESCNSIEGWAAQGKALSEAVRAYWLRPPAEILGLKVRYGEHLPSDDRPKLTVHLSQDDWRALGLARLDDGVSMKTRIEAMVSRYGSNQRTRQRVDRLARADPNEVSQRFRTVVIRISDEEHALLMPVPLESQLTASGRVRALLTLWETDPKFRDTVYKLARSTPTWHRRLR